MEYIRNILGFFQRSYSIYSRMAVSKGGLLVVVELLADSESL